MSRRDGQEDPKGQETPPEDDPERTEPSPDEEQPDEQPDETPEGDEPAGDEGKPKSGDQADKGSDQEKTKDEVDYKAKYEDTEKKRRDHESKAARLENENKQLRQHAESIGNWWRSLVQREAPELYEKIVKAERDRETGSANARATRDASYAVINRVYRDGDKAFGDYLTTLVEDADVKITSQSLERHRRTFDSLKGKGSEADGKPEGDKAPAGGKNGTNAPPRVPAGGRSAPSDDGYVYKDGAPFDVRGNLSAGLAKSRRERERERTGRR